MNTGMMADYARGRKCLDVGCGRDKIPGSTGIDIAVASEADIRHDLGIFPYPVESDAYDAIFCRNVIEHVPNVVKLMEEIHRAGRPGALRHLRERGGPSRAGRERR